MIFGRSIPEKIWLEVIIQFPTSPSWCFSTTWGNKKPIFVLYVSILALDKKMGEEFGLATK